MTVATWNVNSIRARLPIVVPWLEEHQPDLLALQETKVADEQFPHEPFEEIGYRRSIHGQKMRHGVAILTKEPLENETCADLGEGFDQDCRVQCGTLGGIRFINTYVPNGTQVGTDKWEYKMGWLERFNAWVRETAKPDENWLWLGDINIAPTPDDVYEPENKLGNVGHHPDEFALLDAIKEWGWTDSFRKFTEGPGHYTFFDFRMRGSFSRNLGWRIDHIYPSPGLESRITRCWIDPEPRKLERPSDHLPLLAEIAAE